MGPRTEGLEADQELAVQGQMFRDDIMFCSMRTRPNTLGGLHAASDGEGQLGGKTYTKA